MAPPSLLLLFSSLLFPSLTTTTITLQLHTHQMHIDVAANSPSQPTYKLNTSSGAPYHSNQYFTYVGIGTPPRNFLMTVDTGSDLTWVQCEPCIECYPQVGPRYDPQTSSSYQPIHYGSDICNKLNRDLPPLSEYDLSCDYRVAHFDGSVSQGEFISENITLEGSVIPKYGIGCGRFNYGKFGGSAGVFGLGGGPFSFLSQTNMSSISYCLVDKFNSSNSTLQIGATIPTDAITTPLLRSVQNATFFYVKLTGISLGGDRLPINESMFKLNKHSGQGGVILDSGTIMTTFRPEVYKIFRDKFVELSRGRRRAPPIPELDLETCYYLSPYEAANVPVVTLHFGDKSLSLDARNVVFPVDYSPYETYCLAFRGGKVAKLGSTSVIGNVQQQKIRVTIDVNAGQIGFNPSAC